MNTWSFHEVTSLATKCIDTHVMEVFQKKRKEKEKEDQNRWCQRPLIEGEHHGISVLLHRTWPAMCHKQSTVLSQAHYFISQAHIRLLRGPKFISQAHTYEAAQTHVYNSISKGSKLLYSWGWLWTWYPLLPLLRDGTVDGYVMLGI